MDGTLIINIAHENELSIDKEETKGAIYKTFCFQTQHKESVMSPSTLHNSSKYNSYQNRTKQIYEYIPVCGYPLFDWSFKEITLIPPQVLTGVTPPCRLTIGQWKGYHSHQVILFEELFTAGYLLPYQPLWGTPIVLAR